MKRALLEFIYLLASFFKWLFLGALAGVVVGFVGTGFLWVLKTACDFTPEWQYYFVLLPIAMFLSSFLIKYLAPEADGHGTEKAIRAIHKNNGRIGTVSTRNEKRSQTETMILASRLNAEPIAE